MAGIVYYCLDLECNGLAWKNDFHEICELSIIRATDRVQLTRQVKVDKPFNSSYDALRIIGKTTNDLRYGISKQELIRDVESFIAEDNLTPDHRCLIGHNIINFDRKFLWQLWKGQNKTFPFSLFLDTIQLTRNYAKKNGIVKPKVNLQEACDLLKIKKIAGQHNALSDTRNTFLLWNALTKEVDHLDFIKMMPHSLDDDA